MNSPSRIGFVSLGCPKALVDSEQIITPLKAEGYEISPSYEGADLVIVNTCGFIDAAVEESLDAIGEALAENGKVIVTGCLGAKGDTVIENFPDVLAITGPHASEEVLSIVHEHLPPPHALDNGSIPSQGIKLTPHHYAYLKISEGCNHNCTFCIIPDLRGKLVSRPSNDVMEEAEKLAEAGVKELLVISQDTSAYGVDTKYRTHFWQGQPIKTRFYDLTAALSQLDIWVRLHYVYPYPHVDDVIPLMAEGKLLPYLDIPFQHASPNVLKSMKRPAHSENTLERIKRWREICPEIAIRSTFIVGFPGETESDFNQLLGFLEEAQLDRVGCFTYSDVEGAKANTFSNHIPEDIKEERLERLMTLQAQVSLSRLEQRIGQQERILIDEVTTEGAFGRSQREAPEVDGMIFLPNETELTPGSFINVEITEADEHDLTATVIKLS
ncbi:MAG: 30S ribosomal protein S12 methylthiotransferase RimO [Gammaproteobacteria bacterium]|nr:30S ribosomal protein S12 methylthiotransferase RimO [Gammaproteobacteria bacterium]